jgi:UDP-glucose 4-epimerase
VRCTVTGGAGFIGAHLARRLVEDGHEVRVLDNFSTGLRERLVGVDVEVVEGDLRSYERAHAGVRDAEVVFHLGALPSVTRSVQDPLTTNAVNVTGTLNVLLASRDGGARRVVFASSSSIYGASPSVPRREADTPLPISPYGVAKLAAERYCAAFSTVYPIETVALRLFNVYGPGQEVLSQYAAAIPRFAAAMRAGTAPTVYGDGLQTRDFTFVADVVDAFVSAAAAAAAAGHAVNVAAGSGETVLGLVERLCRLTGREYAPRFEPARVADVRHSEGANDLAAELLGWRPRTTLDDGLAAYLAWFDAAPPAS